ncbi:hypothetical protein ACHAWF_001394 [Thalassiosira exigua]
MPQTFNATMSETNNERSAKRRLDLNLAPKSQRPKVENPYARAPRSTRTEDDDVNAKASTITPDAGIEKYFVSQRASKPRAARKLVTPRDCDVQRQDGERLESTTRKPKSLEFNSEDEDPDGLYYHSGRESNATNSIEMSGRIHSSLDYKHRGELPLGQGTLKAYRFIRKNFLVPCNMEADPKFGVHSGCCFEERVLRAYSLALLKPKMPNQSVSSLRVCTNCGIEGHRRNCCPNLV